MITYPPIKFECQVSGKELMAEVVAEEINPGQFNFNTRFSDGFEDIFSHDEKSGIWKASRDKKASYLEKIRDDLSALLSYQIDRYHMTFKYKVGQKLINIWVFETQREGGYIVYTVYYHGDYRFEMKKIAGIWSAKTVRNINPEIIDERLVTRIGERIDAETKV